MNKIRSKNNEDADKKIFLVGSPNVGKSAIFNALTGNYVTVSNYPGTTVDISSGIMRIGTHHRFQVLDTPGMYTLKPLTAEEGVTRKLLFEEEPDCVVHVVDAKNLERMMSLTFQLIETGYPVILVLNLYDEFRARGMQLNIAHLEHDLGIPVVETVATSGLGVENLNSRIVEVLEKRYDFNTVDRHYSPEAEALISEMSAFVKRDYPVSKRSLSVLALQNDEYVKDILRDEGAYGSIEALIIKHRDAEFGYKLARERLAMTKEILEEHLTVEERRARGVIRETLSQLTVHPVFGLPILALVLWFGLYKFVGEFGAGTLVDLIETRVFERFINPAADSFFHKIFGNSILFDLFAGEYGIITLGLTYAFAIILPIVATFFIAFSVIEDTGYLPRLAMLVDKMMKKIGMSGRAIIPLTLGFGCGTMATIVTRTLETKKEKIIATFLLSLAVPCSAQLGVLLGLLGGHPKMLLIWAGTIFLVFILAGFLSKILIKGEEPSFFMELPPLRFPSVINVFTKTYTRMIWYFKEIVPIFVGASIIIWFGKITGIFEFLVKLIGHPVRWAGVPEAASPALLYGFFRRDFGAAGLFDMAKHGELSGNGLLVAAVVLTLFIPCVAHFSVTWKERGKAMAIGMAIFIFPFAFFVGFLLNSILKLLGVSL